MTIEYYRGLKITDEIEYYTKQTKEKANNFNVLTSKNPLKCATPNRAVEGLVNKVIDGLKSKEKSKVIVFFGILGHGRRVYYKSYDSPEIKRQFVEGYENDFNLTDIIKEINNEIKVQCDELVKKGRNKCYEYMNTKIKESTKKIFYDQIGEHIYLTKIHNDEGYNVSLFKDFASNDVNKFQDFVKKVSEEESADVPPEESGDEPDSEESVRENKDGELTVKENAPAEDEDDKTTGGRRRRRRRTASKRRSGKRRVTRKRSTKRRGGKKSGKRKTMKRKH